MDATATRARNDIAQYDDLVDHWWRPDGEFAALHWLARARGALVPPATRPGALLVDVACGGGLLAPHVAAYRHVGIDLAHSALAVARGHGVEPVRGDAHALPLPDGCADVVAAGEVFEHVTDLPTVVAEVCRVLAPGGTVVCDTINATWWARFSLVRVGERLPGGPPLHCHDPALFVDPARLIALFAGHGVALRVHGLRPAGREYLGFLRDRTRGVRMLRTSSLAAVYAGVGTKAAP